MNRIRTILDRIKNNHSLVSDERGLSTVEYVIVLALIAVVAVSTWKTFGNRIHDSITDSHQKMDTALTPEG